MERKIVKLLGFDVDTFSFEKAVDYATELIREKKGGQVVTINPEMIEYALKNPEFAEIIRNAQLVVPDGIGVKLGLKFKGHDVQRIAGVEFAYYMLQRCEANKYPVALIGARPHVIATTAKNLQNRFENLKLVYVQSGYFVDKQRVLKDLKHKAPKLVLVGLGSPGQEIFIKEAREILPNSLMIGVGGSFDVWAGVVERAPEIYQKTGLEWLYRTVKEPKRIKRIFPTLPKFLLRSMFSKER